MNCIVCPMVCKIFFCSEFTVRIPPYSGKVVVRRRRRRRRRREVITKRFAFQGNAKRSLKSLKKFKRIVKISLQ